MKRQIIISLRNVSVFYGDNVALERVRLSVHESEIVSIVGPNGGGKTTLLKTILGIITPQTGSIEVLGHRPQTSDLKGDIGYLPQNNRHAQYFPVTAFDVVAMSFHAKKRFGQKFTTKDKEQIRSGLSLVEMIDYGDIPFGNLSGGQQQRVLIARALACRPKILILDEPSTGLDAVGQGTFYHLLQDIREKTGVTIVLVSHDIGSVSTYADQIACLNRRIHFHGKPQEGIPDKALEKTFGRSIHFLVHDERCASCQHDQ